ncbi:MAG: hypothetical protein ACMZI2_05050 [Candidatus Symbiodolus clandestinus]
MCGIFGLIVKTKTELSSQQAISTINKLYQLSQSRGTESSGLHIQLPKENSAWTLKAAVPATQLTSSQCYKNLFNSVVSQAFSSDKRLVLSPLTLLAHSRLVTNGCAQDLHNNQPVNYQKIRLVHNGIVVNVEQLWKQYPELSRQTEVDSEVVAAILSDNMKRAVDPIQATTKLYQDIEGSASIAWLQDGYPWYILATNTGDIYYYIDSIQGYFLFSSERYILDQAVQSLPKTIEKNSSQIRWLKPNCGLVVNIDSLETQLFSLQAPQAFLWPVTEISQPSIQHQDLSDYPLKEDVKVYTNRADETLLRYNASRLKALTRCSRCILPETFPFIVFDHQGVCNYCHHYQLRYPAYDQQQAKKRLMHLLEPYRRANDTPEVLVPFSGGRDSSYGLHILKTEFNLKIISFTYDWGMVTDLARRNIARLCGKLGVQNILVSADIKKKRENIRKNISAWLKKPILGMVPLFMAGDKHFLQVVNRLKQQTGIKADLWSVNPLENTDFKVGCCNIAPSFSKKRIDALTIQQKIKLISYYGFQFLRNPAYFNRSLVDTFTAFFSYYFEPRNNYLLPFDYLLWKEDTIEQTLIKEYDWELAPDSHSTWRIGDGTAAFYNYIYVTACGFSEFDTFRSNQIREGMLTRDQALQKVLLENQPRLSSLQWYFDTIGIPLHEAISKVNQMDLLGLHDK